MTGSDGLPISFWLGEVAREEGAKEAGLPCAGFQWSMAVMQAQAGSKRRWGQVGS